MINNFKIRRCLHEESKEGWVWIMPPIEKPQFNLIKIINNESKKFIIVSQRKVDLPYFEYYMKRKEIFGWIKNENLLIVSEYYRQKLDIHVPNLDSEEDTPVKLEIISADIFDIPNFLFKHPNEVVKITSALAFISIGISVLPFIIDLAKFIFKHLGHC